MKQSIRSQIEAEQEYIIFLRQDFHRHPELGLQEFRTANRIEEELTRFGISHNRVGETGVVGYIRGELPGKRVIALRADTDALPIQETNNIPYCSQNPGIMHACGHDAHTACLLGAAKVLQANRQYFGGEIRLFFQPAEEIGQGAKLFLQAGLLEGAERVLGLHTAAEVEAGTVSILPGLNNAAVDHFKLTVQGKSAHVSTPQNGVDALYIASQIVVGAQALVTRCSSPMEPVIIGIGTLQSGTVYNAIAPSAVMEGTTRTISLETRNRIRKQVTQLAENIAATYGGTIQIEWNDFAPPLFCDPVVCQEVTQLVDTVWGPGHAVSSRTLTMGGDDFAEFLLQTPGLYAHLGTGNPQQPGTQNPAHNGSFNLDESALVFGAGIYAEYGIWWLSQNNESNSQSAVRL